MSMRGAGSSASRRVIRVSCGSAVLTRQAESNAKAREALLRRGVHSVELPLIEFKSRDEAHFLSQILLRRTPDWVALTSPHAAAVFLNAWKNAGTPPVKIATFDASSKALDGHGAALEVAFVPSRSDGKTLAAELPKREGVCEEVLYPASSKADDAFEKGLRARHFAVTRLDTYETGTVAPESISKELLREALEADVLTFASPTAVRAWIDVAGEQCDFAKDVACIGATTAKRAQELGFGNVYFCESPGLDGLVQSVVDALRAKGKLDGSQMD